MQRVVLRGVGAALAGGCTEWGRRHRGGRECCSLRRKPRHALQARPGDEALVGYQGDQYVRIDTTTGALTNVGGTIGGGFQSSGDIVSVKGGGTYLTVTGANCPTDCLLAVDPATGALVTNFGPTGYSEVYGLAFSAGAVYGFDDGGDLFQINFAGTMISEAMIPIPNAPAGLEFYGAGSTTSAPVTPTQ